MYFVDDKSIFQRENQRVPSSDILQALASGEEIKLSGCTVSGSVDINRLFVKGEDFDISSLAAKQTDFATTVTFEQPIVFNSCVFEENVCFSAPWDSPDELEVIFKRDVVFNLSVFNGQALFGKATFKGLVGFDGCTFERVAVWRNGRLSSRAMFRTVSFKGYSLFSGAVFAGESRFTNTCFSKGGNFTEVRFEGGTDFSGCYSLGKAVPLYESVHFGRHRSGEDETFWRFIKQASQEAGYYRVAGECFYKERCAHFWGKLKGSKYDQLTGIKKFGRCAMGVRLLPELIFGRFLFGYGERPVRVLFACLLIIIACALFYSSPLAQLSSRGEPDIAVVHSFGEGLYFSVTTFTTLGFGDIYPSSGAAVTRSVAMFEAISGAALMALFVVGLSKRYSRG